MSSAGRENSRGKTPDLTSAFSTTPTGASWRPLCEGVEVATILKDPVRDFSAMFLRFAPRSTAMRHVHPDGEQYWVISGVVEDEFGRHEAGSFVNNPPGSVHRPFSDEGALVLVTWFGRLEGYA